MRCRNTQDTSVRRSCLLRCTSFAIYLYTAVDGASLGVISRLDPLLPLQRGWDVPVTPANCRPPPPICAGVVPLDAIQSTHPKAARGRAVVGESLGFSGASTPSANSRGDGTVRRHPRTTDPRPQFARVLHPRMQSKQHTQKRRGGGQLAGRVWG